jgi:hypothetical protein
MATVDKPWDGSASRWDDPVSYCQACLINRTKSGETPTSKDQCSVPVYEPNGDLNVNALGPAAAALNGARTNLADVSSTALAVAKKKLINLYHKAGKVPPTSLTGNA